MKTDTPRLAARRFGVLAAATLLLCSVGPTLATAQEAPQQPAAPEPLSIIVIPTDSVTQPTLTMMRKESAFRRFVIESYVEFSVVLSGPDGPGPLVDLRALRESFIFKSIDANLALDASWSENFQLDGSALLAVDLDVPVDLGRQRHLIGTVRVERTDGGRFETGEYRIGWSVHNRDRVFRNVAGGGWEGHVTNGHTLTVQIKPPTDRREQALRQVVLGDTASSREDWFTANAHYRSAVSFDPSWADARLKLASSYMRLDRPRDAVEALETVGGQAFNESADVSSLLAFAYYRTGDEGNAIRVLRMTGLPESTVRAQLDRFRSQSGKRFGDQ